MMAEVRERPQRLAVDPERSAAASKRRLKSAMAVDAHQNSLLARALQDKEAKQRYEEWRQRYIGDTGAVIHWVQRGCPA